MSVHMQCDGPLARLTLDRPDVHNAFNAQTIERLTDCIRQADADEAVRVILLAARGRSFCAGADLNWMREMVRYSPSENERDSRQLADMMAALNYCAKPTIARVHGAAFGGGVGLVACCDIAIASRGAKFGLSEVKLGLAPAVISPYVVRAIGDRWARRLMLTAETFDAATAQQIGLIHEQVDDDTALDARIDAVVAWLLRGGPNAQRATKRLLQNCFDDQRGRQPEIDRDTAALIASLRVSDEGQAGLRAFLDHQPAPWTQDV